MLQMGSGSKHTHGGCKEKKRKRETDKVFALQRKTKWIFEVRLSKFNVLCYSQCGCCVIHGCVSSLSNSYISHQIFCFIEHLDESFPTDPIPIFYLSFRFCSCYCCCCSMCLWYAADICFATLKQTECGITSKHFQMLIAHRRAPFGMSVLICVAIAICVCFSATICCCC